MSEGLGSTVIIAIIVVFIALVSAYMAYNVNYTKAFKMKNKVIATIEKYQGECGAACKTEISKYAGSIGYHPKAGNFCDNNPFKPQTNYKSTEFISDPGYCLYKVDVPVTNKSGLGTIEDDYNHEAGYYYRVVSIINIRVPIIENVMQFNYVSGDTKEFRKNTR